MSLVWIFFSRKAKETYIRYVDERTGEKKFKISQKCQWSIWLRQIGRLAWRESPAGIKYIAVLALVSFIFHIIWENAQAPLYQGYESFWQHFPVCSMGAVGDVGITLVFAGVLWLLKPDQWMRLGWRDYAVLAIAGFFTAVLIEQHALLVDKWAYTQAMPLVPYFRVGLTPVLQMTILLPLTFRIAHAVQSSRWLQRGIDPRV